MKKVLSVFNPPQPHWVGDGFPVRSLFTYHGDARAMSPFLLLDYAGPAQFPPAARRRGVGGHPHRGFETVTIVYQGEVEHRDSTGTGGSIGPGDVQWMTAAAGILHEEMHSAAFTRTGGPFEVMQLWVNLPARDKMSPPGYQTLLNSDIPVVDLPDGAGQVRIIAGEYVGRRGPARTFTPINVWDGKLVAGARAQFDLPSGHTLAVAVRHGELQVNGSVVRPAQLAQLERAGERLELVATAASEFLMLAGEPIDEPVFGYGPFVMNTREEIEQAIEDFNSGKFGHLAA